MSDPERPKGHGMASLKEEHDELLAKKPEGADHDAEACVYCNPESTQGGDMKTYTEDELSAAVNEAVAPLLTELTTLRDKESQEAVEARIAEAVATASASVEELQNKLDAAELRAETAEQEHEKIVAWLTAEAKALEEADLATARREERRDAVKEVASAFTDEQIESKLDRWVAMDDDAFETLLDGLKDVAAANPSKAPLTQIPVDTAMNHTRSSQAASAVGDLFGLLKDGIDPRTLS